MQDSISDNGRRFDRARAYGLLMLTYCLLGAATLWAQDKPTAPESSGPIHISADRLISDTTQRTAEFIGSVKVVQGTTTITADRMKLSYKGGDGAKGGEPSAESIDTIETMGHVRIAMDNRVALGEKAVYTTRDRKLVISGPGAQISSGPDVIEGSTITFYRDTGKVEMVGQVKAIIRSDQRGLN